MASPPTRPAASKERIPDDPRRSERALDRLVAFSDAVIAIAITLIVLPLVDRAMEASDAAAFFSENATSVFSAALSFVVIAAFWRANHAMFVRARGYNRALMRLQMVWLGSMIFLPVATALDVVGPSGDRVALGAYLGCLVVTSTVHRLETIVLQRSGLTDDLPATGMTHWTGPVIMVLALLLALAFPQIGAAWLALLLLEPVVARVRSLPRRRSGS